jgi:hypothetical protein
VQKGILSKALKQKPKSSPLTPQEIADVKKALKEKKGRVFKTPESAIDDLHKYVANS